MKKLTVYSVVLALVVFSSVAGAGVIFSDNFEDGTLNTTPAGWAAKDSSSGDPADVLDVVNSYYTSAYQSMQWADWSSDPEYVVYRSFDEQTSGHLVTEYRVKSSAADQLVYLGGVSDGDARCSTLRFSYNTFGYYDGTTYVNTGVTCLANTWYTVKITDYITGTKAKKWDVEVWDNITGTGDTIVSATGMGWNDSSAVAPDQFQAAGIYGNKMGTTYFDDVSVTQIPEPATMSLLLLSLPFVLRRRR